MPAFATTGPSQHYATLVKITRGGIQLFEFIGYTDSPYGDLVPVSGPIQRGSDMSFTVLNSTKKAQNFKIMGSKTGLIKPGQKAHLHVVFISRGKFPYESTLEIAPAFHGFVVVV